VFVAFSNYAEVVWIL